MNYFWINTREFGANKSMQLKKVLAIGVLSSFNWAYAAMPTSGAGIKPSLNNLSSFIESGTYTKVNLSENLGKFISESQALSYKPDELYQYYRAKVCEGVYWFNCKANLKHIKQDTGIDFEQKSALIGHSFSKINAHRLIYTTLGMDNQARKVSGAVLIPQSSQPLKGVVIVYHVTVLNKENVPSNFKLDGFNFSKNMASILASDGYVVVMPDYLGMGVDESAVHPYVIYPEVNALSGIYMLDSLKKIQPNLKFSLVKNQIPLYLTGYSEGGSYALWAAKILQDNKSYLAKHGYYLTKTVPMEGVYNLSKVTLPFLVNNSADKVKQAPFYLGDARIASFAKPGFVANVLNAYAHYDLHGNESAVFSPAFAACKGCEVGDKFYTVSALLQAAAGEKVKYSLIHDAASAIGYSNQNNSILSLTNPQLLNSSQFLARLAAADIYNWKATTPVSFLTMEYDSSVTRLNSETAYSAMSAQGSSSLNLKVISNQNYKTKSYLPFMDMNIDHSDGLTFMLLFARNQFDERSVSVNSN